MPPTSLSTTQVAPSGVSWSALGPTLAVTLLSTTIVSLRLYTRHSIIRKLHKEDYLILLSLLLSWTNTAIIIHTHQVPTPHLPHTAKLVLTSNTLWALTTSLTKTSLLIQYLSLFPSPAPSTLVLCLRRTSIALLLALVPITLWAILGGLIICLPLQKTWTPSLPGRCSDPRTYWLSVASMDVVSDVLIWTLPLPIVIGMKKITLKERVGLFTVFGLGIVVFAIGLTRLVVVHVAASGGRLAASGTQALVWSAVEVNVSLLCAGGVALKPLVMRIGPRLQRWTGTGIRDPGTAGSRSGQSTLVGSWSARKGSTGTTMVASGSVRTKAEVPFPFLNQVPVPPVPYPRRVRRPRRARSAPGARPTGAEPREVSLALSAHPVSWSGTPFANPRSARVRASSAPEMRTGSGGDELGGARDSFVVSRRADREAEVDGRRYGRVVSVSDVFAFPQEENILDTRHDHHNSENEEEGIGLAISGLDLPTVATLCRQEEIGKAI